MNTASFLGEARSLSLALGNPNGNPQPPEFSSHSWPPVATSASQATGGHLSPSLTGHLTLLSQLRSTLGPQLTFDRLCLLQHIFKGEKIYPKVYHINSLKLIEKKYFF